MGWGMMQLTSNAEKIKSRDDSVLWELAGRAIILLVRILVAFQRELMKGPRREHAAERPEGWETRLEGAPCQHEHFWEWWG